MEDDSQWSELQRFILPEVTTTREVLGTGAYGLVLEVSYKLVSYIKQAIFF